jgi:Tol biopolymer transport system component
MLASGTRLGPYEILEMVGEGGMGQVFKARDTRLERLVAVKILPAALAADPVRRERFEREARNVSRLEHPNICPLYDVGEYEGHLYLVMQFLDGETLADRLKRGPLSITQCLEYGTQIAEALAAAHRAGIVHRDLKPGNVMVTRSGVRLLDFGLARAVPGNVSTLKTTDGSSGISNLTTEGTIVGTLAYMAPEQIDGREIDTRADVFAFGAVMFEMVTGLRAFDGESPARVMSAILRDEPARVSSIVPVAPAALEALIHSCLEKDPNDRWQNIGDVARQLKHLREMMSGPKSGPVSSPGMAVAMPAAARRGPRMSPRVAWIAAGVFALVAAALLIARFQPSAPARAPLQLHALLLPPEGRYLTDTLALSPDGTALAFVAGDLSGRQELWLRRLNASGAQRIEGTEGAADPFWSPDGQQIAFFSGNRLKRVPVGGGAATTICELGNGGGGTWGAGDQIVFAQLDGPLMRVSASGGRPEPLAAFDRALEETHHLYPAFLPDGRHFVYYINSRERGLYVGSVDGQVKKRLFDPDPALPAGAAATPGLYAASGHLLYVRDRVLSARLFDLDGHEASGPPVTVAETVDYDPPGKAAFTVAGEVLVYRARQHRPLAEIAWVDRTGAAVGTVPSPPGSFRSLALSPDGRTIAVDRRDAQGLPSVWLIDAAAGTSDRLTSTYWSGDPLWGPGGRTLAFSVAADSPPNIVVRDGGGHGSERRLTTQPTEQHYATSFTPDGHHIVYTAATTTTGLDLFMVATHEGTTTPQRLLQTAANEMQGRVAPDGRWLAYVSDESGQREVYVTRFPEMQGRTAVSSGGGSRPFWRADGRELFYLSADGAVTAVSIQSDAASLQPGRPVPLFKTTLYESVYAPDAKGERFVIARPIPTNDVVPLDVVVNPLR